MSLFYTNETNTLKNHKEKVGDIMTSLKNANRRAGSLFAVAALLLATITPGLVPAFASAAQLSERSVELSNSSKAMLDVDYKVTFTATTAGAGAVVLDFCSNTPLTDAECDVPAGFSVASANAAGFTDSDLGDARNNARVFTGTIAAVASPTTITLEGVNNPTAAGPLYVRIATFDTEANAQAYTSETASTATGKRDQGSAAISITDTVGVSAAVLETMTFCVSGAVIADCASTTPPTVELGEDNDGVVALSSGEISTGDIYTRISTNAASGAVVNLRSNATGCGGLLRAGAAPGTCDIKPADGTVADADFDGQALFGIKVTGATADADGAFGIVAASGYTSSAFLLNYDDPAQNTGVTSPYGDPVLDTAGAPANNKNAQITFGASIANNTPAGRYSADFSLIATGKF